MIGCLLSLGPVGAMAADWSYEPRVALSAEYDDNHRLTNVPGQEIEVYGPKLDARLVIARQHAADHLHADAAGGVHAVHRG